MISRWAVWQRYRWLWIAPAIFVLLNLLVWGFYQLRFAGTVDSMESRYQAAADELELIGEETADLQAFLAEVERTRGGLRELYEQRFATEEERYTQVNREIRELARRAGAPVQAFAHARKKLGNTRLVQLTLSFNIEATYDQLRTFINLLELSDHFLTLESVSMSGNTDDPRNPQLGVRIAVSTIFNGPDADTGPARGASP